jgi:pyrroline-5-carboxylate reductase
LIKNSGDNLIKNNMLLNAMKQSPGLKIGIIGAGRLGRQLATSLIECADTNPVQDLQISTRQPDTLTSLIQKDVVCYFDNIRLVKRSDIVFLCILPSQMETIINEIRSHIPTKCIIYSFVRTHTDVLLQKSFKTTDNSSLTFVMRPLYKMNRNSVNDIYKKWDYTLDIAESLLSDNVSFTNPFYRNKGSFSFI